MSDVIVKVTGHVTEVALTRPPHNFVDQVTLAFLADAVEAADADSQCRVIILGSRGKSFCAGADFNAQHDQTAEEKLQNARQFYSDAMRLFRARKPIVAAIQGAAVGAGLGLALAADFRVASTQARFSGNFTRIGFHPGFGITETLPDIVGRSHAALLLLTGRRIDGAEAYRIGLADMVVAPEDLHGTAFALATEIAESSPLGVVATRSTLRRDLPDRVEAALERELAEQTILRETEDFAEGVKAMTERRKANFKGC